jgi:ubiquinol-cytochrome c reductase iron-sulfur subunit
MSNEIESIKDPGLPAHVHRKADTDPKAANRAERQVATMFLVSALGTVLPVSYTHLTLPTKLL